MYRFWVFETGLAKKLLCVQIALLLMVSGLFALHGNLLGLSVFMGMLVMWCANGYFLVRLFYRRKPDFDPKRFLINFYLGEVGKLLILALGTALCAKFLALTWWAYIVGVALMQCSMWLAPLWLKEKGPLKNDANACAK